MGSGYQLQGWWKKMGEVELFQCGHLGEGLLAGGGGAGSPELRCRPEEGCELPIAGISEQAP